jgi:predicted ATP-binding protein involved in virulence
VEIKFSVGVGEHIRSMQSYKVRFVNGFWVVDSHSVELNNYILKINTYPHQKFEFALFAYSGYRRLDQINLSAIQELEQNPLIQSLDFDSSINPQLLIQWIANTKTKEALSIAKNDLTKATQYHDAIARIEEVISEITEQSISFELEDSPLAVTIKADGINLKFNSLPDGLKSIISWIADLLMRMDRLPWQGNLDVFDRNFILFLDEIDVHLHPKWQRKILPVVQRLFRNAQIFVSTHSPFIIGSIDNAWVYKFEKQNGFSHLSSGPLISEDAKSYRMILEEIFDINKQFGVKVEAQLDQFYSLKSQIIAGGTVDIAQFSELVKNLAAQSVELESIIGMEIKQLKKLKGEQFEISI